MDDSLYIQFVRRLLVPGCSLLAGEANNVLIELTPVNYNEFVTAHQDKNLYLVGGVDPSIGLQRSKQTDIRSKNYCVIDIDLRKQSQAEGKEISDDGIKEIGHWLTGALADHPYLNNWAYIVFSGNGIHIWYIGKPVPVTSVSNWGSGMKKLLDDFEKHTKLQPDTACTNVANLFRVPGSYNNKDGRHTFVEILCTQ